MRAVIGWCVAGSLAGGTAFGQDGRASYVVDAARSDLHWLVYKAGALGRLGHNHTIAVGDLRGTVSVNESDFGASRFELQFAVASLVVDDPTLRATLGADFSTVPTADDVAGTKVNMLSDRVLDGANHPRIRIVGSGPVTREGIEVLRVEVDILGRAVELAVPTSVTVADGEVHASGEFELDLADLGIRPFKVMMGALQVREKLSFSYDVKARRAAR